MQGTIAQTVALTIAGNDFIHGQQWGDFWPNGTVFTFCKSVSFANLSGPPNAPTESPFADDPLRWLSKVADEGTIGFRLHHIARNNAQISDRMSMGFVGGGQRSLIETVRSGRSDLWEARWRVQDQNDPDRKIWEVVYFRVAKDRASIQPSTRGLPAIKNELHGILAKIEDFACRQKLNSFAQSFHRGMALLNAEAPLDGVHHSDLDHNGHLPLDARQILAAAQAAWVFGGMGSWNDLGFEGQDQDQYTVLSDTLFLLLNQAICEAANSGFPGSA